MQNLASLQNVRGFQKARVTDPFTQLFQAISALPGLVAYYPLNETSGNAINQAPATFGTLNGTVTGATQGVAGQIGNAYSFDGVNDYIDTNYAPNFSASDKYTFNFLLKAPTQGSTKDLFGSVAEQGANDSAIQIQLQSDGNIRFFVRDGVTGANIGNTPTSYPNDAWAMITLVKRATNSFEYYKNGTSVATNNTTISTQNFTGYNFYVGCSNVRGTPASYMQGLVQHVAILSRDLSTAEVLRIAQIAGLA